MEDASESIYLLGECVCSLVGVWKSYDWKSRVDWRSSRRALMVKAVQAMGKWVGLLKMTKG